MATARPAVLVVGSVNVDLVVRVGRLPRPGETVSGGSFERHHGGKGANQAVAAARLGADVIFVGAVGDDEPGRSAAAALESERVDVSRLAVLGGTPTGVAAIVVDERGENQIAVASGANAALDAALVEEALTGLRPATPAVYLASLEVPDDAVLAGARFAADAGLRIVINPAPARPLPAELLELEPILLPNEGEARLLSGEADPAGAARALVRRTRAAVAVTLAARGAVLVEDAEAEPIAIPAARVAVVDSTGAGDTFAGAFAAELARGASVRAATELAVAAASVAVSMPGARGGMPARDQVTALLNRRAAGSDFGSSQDRPLT